MLLSNFVYDKWMSSRNLLHCESLGEQYDSNNASAKLQYLLKPICVTCDYMTASPVDRGGGRERGSRINED